MNRRRGKTASKKKQSADGPTEVVVYKKPPSILKNSNDDKSSTDQKKIKVKRVKKGEDNVTAVNGSTPENYVKVHNVINTRDNTVKLGHYEVLKLVILQNIKMYQYNICSLHRKRLKLDTVKWGNNCVFIQQQTH